MNKKYIEFYSIMGFLTVGILVLLIGKYYFGWFSTPEQHYAKFEVQSSPLVNDKITKASDDEAVTTIEATKDVKLPEVKSEITKKPVTKEVSLQKNEHLKTQAPSTQTKNMEVIKPKEYSKIIQENKEKPVTTKTKVQEVATTPIVQPERTIVQKISGTIPVQRFVFSEQNFHSLGEYVSTDEYEYRKALTNNLVINTVVIDKLSKGNGISQEFFKVAYQANMIPAKILADIVESKEFRDLIPKEMLAREMNSQIKPGEQVVFNGNAY